MKDARKVDTELIQDELTNKKGDDGLFWRVGCGGHLKIETGHRDFLVSHSVAVMTANYYLHVPLNFTSLDILSHTNLFLLVFTLMSLPP